MSGVHAPSGLPEVHDEAGDTPAWLPALGLALLAVVLLWLVTQTHGPSERPTEAADIEPVPAHIEH